MISDPRLDPVKVGETKCKDCKHNPLLMFNPKKLPGMAELTAHIQACMKCQADPSKAQGYEKIGDDTLEVIVSEKDHHAKNLR